MKQIVLGKGYRVLGIVDSLAEKGAESIVITNQKDIYDRLAEKKVARYFADPENVRFQEMGIAIGREDIVIFSFYEASALENTLQNFYAAQGFTVPVWVFTPIDSTTLKQKYPLAVFRNDQALYKNEMKSITRTFSTIVKLDAIRAIIAETDRVLVVIWGNPDPDAIASAYALRSLLKANTENYTISYTGEFTRPENVAMVNTLKIPTVKFDQAMIDDKTTVVTVDAQPSFFTNGDSMKIDIVIDHHPRKPMNNPAFADIRPTYGSTSTILTEYFRNGGIKMSKRTATALFYGLKVDTNNLQRKVSDADISAFRYLHKIADENIIRNIELSQLPMHTLDSFGVALMKKRAAKDVLFTYMGRADNPDICVHIADFYIKVEGISWAIVSSVSNDKLIVVFRSDGLRKHAGKVASSLFKNLGTAGGHRVMARAEIGIDVLKNEIDDISDKNVEEWLIKRLSTKIKGFRKIQP